MTSLKSAAFGLAMVALAGAASIASSASAEGMKMSMKDKKMMTSCSAMSHDDMMKDSGCMAMMSKMKMSDSDMMKMSSCNAMDHGAMMKDESCMAMMKMHPGMMK